LDELNTVSNTDNEIDKKPMLSGICEIAEFIAVNNTISDVFVKTIEEISITIPSDCILLAELRPESEKYLLLPGDDSKKSIIRKKMDLPSLITNILVHDVNQLNGTMHSGFFDSIFGNTDIAQGVSVVIPGFQHPLGILIVCTSKSYDYNREEIGFLKTTAMILSNLLNCNRSQSKVETELGHIEAAKGQLENIIDTLPDVICLIDKYGNIVRINNAIEQWGVSRVVDVKGKSVHKLLHPNCNNDNCDFMQKWQNAWKNPAWEHSDWVVHDKVLDKKLNISLRRLCNQNKNIAALEQGSIVAVFHDETHLQFQDNARPKLPKKVIDLNHSNQLSNGVVNRLDTREFASPAGLIKNLDIAQQQSVLLDNNIVGIYITFEGTIIYCNRQFAAILCYRSTDDLYYKKLSEFFVGVKDRDNKMEPESSDNVTNGHQDIQARRADGENIWLSKTEIEIWSDGRLLNLGYVVDITQQKAMEDTILKSRKELHALSRQLLNAQEDERKKLASELHDGIGQHLSAAKMEVEISLKLASSSSVAETSQRLKMAISRIKETIEEVRNLSMDLRPSTLDDLGLLITVAWFSRQYQSAYPHLEVNLDKGGVEEKDIPEGRKVVIYRIIQEALNNIAKHAQATHIDLLIEKIDNNHLRLFIRDNGIGFDVDKVSTVTEDRMKFGLKSMRERVESSGGSFSINSERTSTNNNKGTAIEAIWAIH